MKIEENNFFSGFTEEGKNSLIELAEYLTLPDGALIFREEDRSDGVYLLLEGEVILTKKAGGDREETIATVIPGGYFGEMGVLEDCGRSASARTSGKTRLAKIPARPLLDILRREPSESSWQILRQVSGHLRETNIRFVRELIRKEKLQLVGRMAGSIIHDFKNPMTSIVIAAEIIADRNPDETTSEYCDMIRRQIKRMTDMTRDLIDYARGDSRLNRERISVKDLLSEFEKLNADYLKKNKIDYSIKPIDAEISVDRLRLFRSLQNLLGNAVEALGEGGGKIALTARPVDDGIELRIEDNGPGIPEEIRDTVFDPFVTRGKRMGTGLGMAIVKENIEAHGGTISFESRRGEGTVFVIRLPGAGQSD